MTVVLIAGGVVAYLILASLLGKFLKRAGERTELMTRVDGLNRVTTDGHHVKKGRV